MVGVLVPLVPCTAFAFDGVAPGTVVSTTMVQRMPLFAWAAGSLLVRIEDNTLAAVDHKLEVQLVRTAPTSEEPAEAFPESAFAALILDSATDAAAALMRPFAGPNPPFADLVITQKNVGATQPAGAIAISVAVLVRGRAFDRIDHGRDDEAQGAPL